MKFFTKFQIFRLKMTTTLFREEAYTIEWINYPVQGPSFPPGTTNVIIEFKGVDGHPTAFLTVGPENHRIARVYTKNKNFDLLVAPPGTTVTTSFRRKAK